MTDLERINLLLKYTNRPSGPYTPDELEEFRSLVLPFTSYSDLIVKDLLATIDDLRNQE